MTKIYWEHQTDCYSWCCLFFVFGEFCCRKFIRLWLW